MALIAGSIREFGFTNPVLVDGENGIIAGHGRLLAARKLGLDRGAGDRAGPPQPGAEAGATSWPTTSSPSGPAGTGSCWRSRWGSWRSSAWTSPSLGFEAGEIDDLLHGERTDPREEETPEPPEPSRCRGRAISGCSAGTACSAATPPTPAAVARLLGGVAPQLMVTDPPYGVDYDPAWRNEQRQQPNQADRQGAERRPGGLARGLGAVPRRCRLRLARRAACRHGGREPRGLRLRDPQPDHLGQGAAGAQPRPLPLAARALLVCGARERQGRTGPATGSRPRSGRSRAATRTRRRCTARRSRSSACAGRC